MVRKGANGEEEEVPYIIKAAIPLLQEGQQTPILHEIELKLRNQIRLVGHQPSFFTEYLLIYLSDK